MKLKLGLKSDPINYRYSYPWLFRLMAKLGVTELQLGTFFEIYQLPDSFFVGLRKEAADFGINISSVFTAHRELGGFFREDEAWVNVARRNYERLIQVGALLGAQSVGSNPGALPRDLMGLKEAGSRRYLQHMQELMVYACSCGVPWLTIEPMSCLAEPPTTPEEIRQYGEILDTAWKTSPGTHARVGYCTDIAHGYLDTNAANGWDNVALFEATLPWLYEVHLKNTDGRYHSTFGFEPANLAKGIVDIAGLRQLLLRNAAIIPVQTLTGYLEIGGPKLGRDYTDYQLESQLTESFAYLRESFLGPDNSSISDEASANPVVITTARPTTESNQVHPPKVLIAPSMMCVDSLNFEDALRRVENLGVDMLHIDVMDARFVPNMPIGLSLLKELSAKTHLPIDVHLMVEDNDFFIRQIADCRIHQISVHYESCRHLDRTLAMIRETGARAGLAINPATPLDVLEFALERLDYVLLMTVNPGFAGQKLTPASLRKIKQTRTFLDNRGQTSLPIQVDGNVSFANIPSMVMAGARNLVAGTSSIFHSGNSWSNNMKRLKLAIEEGLQQSTSSRESSAA